MRQQEAWSVLKKGRSELGFEIMLTIRRQAPLGSALCNLRL